MFDLDMGISCASERVDTGKDDNEYQLHYQAAERADKNMRNKLRAGNQSG